MNRIDLEELRIDGIPATKVETSVSKRREERRGREFIMFPLSWLDRLSKTKRRATVFVALCLLELKWRSNDKSAPVPLSNLRMEELGISRYEKWRALKELEAHGFVTVERAKGRSPRVTLLQTCRR